MSSFPNRQKQPKPPVLTTTTAGENGPVEILSTSTSNEDLPTTSGSSLLDFILNLSGKNAAAAPNKTVNGVVSSSLLERLALRSANNDSKGTYIGVLVFNCLLSVDG